MKTTSHGDPQPTKDLTNSAYSKSLYGPPGQRLNQDQQESSEITTDHSLRVIYYGENFETIFPILFYLKTN